MRRCSSRGWRLRAGPERIESGGWDGGDIARDHHLAEDAIGRRGWLFRDRRDGGWYLHGLFGWRAPPPHDLDDEHPTFDKWFPRPHTQAAGMDHDPACLRNGSARAPRFHRRH